MHNNGSNSEFNYMAKKWNLSKSIGFGLTYLGNGHFNLIKNNFHQSNRPGDKKCWPKANHTSLIVQQNLLLPFIIQFYQVIENFLPGINFKFFAEPVPGRLYTFRGYAHNTCHLLNVHV